MLNNFVTELEKQAGEEGWGGEFREEMFGFLLNYFSTGSGRKSAGGLLSAMVKAGRTWMADSAAHEEN